MSAQPESMELPQLSANELNGVEISLRVHEVISEFGGC
jgi:hypothetical protein